MQRKMNKCPECGKNLRMVMVSIEDAETKAKTYQCPHCDYFRFDPLNKDKIMKEVKQKEQLRAKQKIIKFSNNRLGVYLNPNIVKSLDLRAGEEVNISVPDPKHILVSLKSTNKQLK